MLHQYNCPKKPIVAILDIDGTILTFLQKWQDDYIKRRGFNVEMFSGLSRIGALQLPQTLKNRPNPYQVDLSFIFYLHALAKVIKAGLAAGVRFGIWWCWRC